MGTRSVGQTQFQGPLALSFSVGRQTINNEHRKEVNYIAGQERGVLTKIKTSEVRGPGRQGGDL